MTEQEIHELYSRQILNQIEREEYFSLDPSIKKILAKMRKIETKIYLILLIGYFRAKPVVAQFKLLEVKQDVDHIYAIYFPNRKPKYPFIAKSTRATLITKMYEFLGFSRLLKRNKLAFKGCISGTNRHDQDFLVLLDFWLTLSFPSMPWLNFSSSFIIKFN
uniref:DUF4158 domain-containing protein n=1 Tax=Pectobacterium carotovorum TaxID=554 RepID=A0A0N9NL87_PECCA|nr:DUF4158 domain-containing protein [Pectobacterium carotovorum]ALG88536.1 Hypothetical protein [Pectobacterium carotovorum]